MNLHKSRRNRGVILSPSGFKKVYDAKLELEFRENFGDKYTFEELSERIGLSSITLAKVLACKEKVDKRTLANVFEVFDLELNQNDYLQPTVDFNINECSITSLDQDWGEAVDVSVFYGRAEELTKLHLWLLNEHCRIVALLGMGGIGKTSLSVMLAKQIQHKFEYVIWQSLYNAPLLKDILTNLIQFLSKKQETERELQESTSCRVSRLMNYLRSHRCLIVLDNAETILQSGVFVGQYREGYEDYSQFFRQIGEVPHQSCLLLTSREKFREIASFEGEALPIRSLQLSGLREVEAQKIFQHKNLSASETEWKTLIERYTGNPLALKIVSTTIQDVFDGDVTVFLQQSTVVFGDLYELLKQQFERLSDLEKEIMYWLMINRKPISFAELNSDLMLPVPSKKILEALESLNRRSLLNKKAALFTLPSLIMDYITSQFVEKIFEELFEQKLVLFKTISLLKVQSEHHIQCVQNSLILKQILKYLMNWLKNRTNLENYFKKLLSDLQKTSYEPGYTVGNIINLLRHLKIDLSGYDFSSLTIWQANLKCTLKKVNFSQAEIAKSVFTQVFSNVYSLTFSPNGKFLAASDVNGDICLWQVFADGEQILTFQKDADWVHSITHSTLQEVLRPTRTLTANSPDSGIISSLSNNPVVNWQKNSTKEPLTFVPQHFDGVTTITFSPDGQTLAGACMNQTVKLWDTNTGFCKKILQGHTSSVKFVVFGCRGQILASGSDDKTVRLWSVTDGKCLRTLEHDYNVWSVAFSNEGKTLATGCEDYKVHLWDVSTGFCDRKLQGHIGWVLSVAFSPKDNILASGSKDKTIKLWNFSYGECIKTLQGHIGWVLSVAFSPDGNILASSSMDRTVKLWDIRTGQCLKTLEEHTHCVRSVAFNPQGNMLASSSEDRTVKLWDIVTGECLGTLTNSKPYEGMNITGVTGLTEETIASLKMLGAIENSSFP